MDKVKTRGREGAPFLIRTSSAEGERDYLASAVIDATGTWSQPNPLGANGLPAIGEAAAAARIAYGMPDVLGRARADYAGQRVLVAGAGHSAAGTLLALAQLADEAPGTCIVWAIRGDQLAKVFGGGEADGLPARGQLGLRLKALKESGRLALHTNFRIQAVQPGLDGLDVTGVSPDGQPSVIEGIDRIIAATWGATEPGADTRAARAPRSVAGEHRCPGAPDRSQ
ncbi:hypothetical protein ACHMW6_24920 [Pseudoduganella sp. UC29_106]|uniref:hypothetical protein n=1 Tax=Pseudoduganella sp. UC29_106 TaxID=3374553 RepID=UPI0037574B48